MTFESKAVDLPTSSAKVATAKASRAVSAAPSSHLVQLCEAGLSSIP